MGAATRRGEPIDLYQAYDVSFKPWRAARAPPMRDACAGGSAGSGGDGARAGEVVEGEVVEDGEEEAAL